MSLPSLSFHGTTKFDRPRQIGVAGATLLYALLIIIFWPRETDVGLPEMDGIEVEIIALNASDAADGSEPEPPAPTQLPPIANDELQSAIRAELTPHTPAPKTVAPEDFKPAPAAQFAEAAKPQTAPAPQPAEKAQPAPPPKPLPAVQFQDSVRPQAIATVKTQEMPLPINVSPPPAPAAQFEAATQPQTQAAAAPQPSAANAEESATFQSAANQLLDTSEDEGKRVAQRIVQSTGKDAGGFGSSAGNKKTVTLSEHLLNEKQAKDKPIYDSPALHNPPPEYPPEARARGIQGTVYVFVQVGFDGEPTTVELWQTSNNRALDEAALRAVRKWHFIPAIRNGVVASASVIIPLEFKLQ